MRTMENVQLERMPLFLKSPSGGVYIKRLRRNMAGRLEVVQEKEQTGSFSDSGANAVFTDTYKHNLQTHPFIMGFVRVFQGTEVETAAVYPMPFGDTVGDVIIGVYDITKTQAVLTGTISLGAGQGWKYRWKIRLFKEI